MLVTGNDINQDIDSIKNLCKFTHIFWRTLRFWIQNQKQKHIQGWF